MAAYDRIMEDRKRLVERLIKNMENGDLIFKKGWDVSLLRPTNPVSGANYLGGNRLRLMDAAIERNYKDPRWMTYKQAQEKGWHVKRGESGVLCEKWIYDKKIKETDENGKTIEKEIKLEKPFPSYFIVFNAEQIEGIPPIEITKAEKGQITEIAEDFIKSSECKIKEVAQDKAYYSPSEDEIVIPLREAFKSEEAFLRTALHEMCHSTGHESRLNRDLTGFYGTKKYAKEELVAELGSVFTQARLNIQLEGEHFNDHTVYLKSWIKVLEEDPNELFRAAVKAEAASERLYNNYIEKEKELVKQFARETEEQNKDPMKELKVQFHWSEFNFGLPEETTLTGKEAYNFLEQVMTEDKKQNLKQQIMQDQIDRGEEVDGLFYYKTKLTISYENFERHGRFDLGDLEFGGHLTVSDGLKYRFMGPIESAINNPDFYVEHNLMGENMTKEDVVKYAKKEKRELNSFVGILKMKEQVLNNQKNKQNSKEIKKVQEKENIQTRKKAKNKNKGNER